MNEHLQKQKKDLEGISKQLFTILSNQINQEEFGNLIINRRQETNESL
jgi:hypothetical protein